MARTALKGKHAIVGIFAFTVALVIYAINRQFGNSPARAWPISVLLLCIAYIPFALVWVIKDTWRARWIALEQRFPNLRRGTLDASHESFSIPVENAGSLQGNIFWRGNSSQSRKGCVLLLHGYSDTQATIAYLVDFLLRSNYCVVTYDARGVGESRRAGKKNDFLSKIWEDFPRVIKFLQTHVITHELPLAVVGSSMGASPALIGGTLDPHVRAIIAVSALSDRNLNLRWTWNPFTPQFWLCARYFLLGIPYHVPPEINTQTSPMLALSEARKRRTPEEWARLVVGRVYLVHCTNDKTVSVNHFHTNMEALAIPPEQAILLAKGGHMYFRAELFLGSMILRILDTNLAQSGKSELCNLIRS